MNINKQENTGFCTAVIVIMVLMSCLALPYVAMSAPEPVVHLRVGFSSKVFISVPKEDIRVAVNVLSQKVARKTVGSAVAKVYNNTAEIEKDLKAGKVDMVGLSAEEYIQLRPHVSVEPVMSTVSGNTHEVELVMLTRNDSRINRVAELKNRSLALPSKYSQAGVNIHKWIETLVMKEGAPTPAAFFSNRLETLTASQAILPVFFRKVDACIVTRQAFEVTSELNPQIARDLKVIANINHLSGGIIVLRSDLPEDLKQKIKQVLLTLHEDQEGKQMFLLFQISRLTSYSPEHLKGTEALYTEHRKLKARMLRQ